MNENAAHSACEREPLPADFICPACGYDLSGAIVERCSECGLEIDRAVRNAHEARREYVARKGWRRDVMIGASPIAFGAGVGAGTGSAFGLISAEILLYVALHAGLMVFALAPGWTSTAIYASKMPRKTRLAWFGALVGMQVVAQLPIMCGQLMSMVLNNLGVVADGLGALVTMLPVLAMLIGLLFVTRLWKVMWSRSIQRAGLVLNRRIDRHVHAISIISLTPSLLFFLGGVVQTIFVLFFSV